MDAGWEDFLIRRRMSEAEAEPVVVPDEVIAECRVFTPDRSIPVWVDLTFDDDRPPRRQEGFAVAWTRQHVQVSVNWKISYYTSGREFWVAASQVSRRKIEPRYPGRDSAVHGFTRPQPGWKPS